MLRSVRKGVESPQIVPGRRADWPHPRSGTMPDYTAIPRPPWMFQSTPYLQDLYRRNRAQIDAAWQTWAAANPDRAASIMRQYGSNQMQPSGGPVGYQP